MTYYAIFQCSQMPIMLLILTHYYILCFIKFNEICDTTQSSCLQFYFTWGASAPNFIVIYTLGLKQTTILHPNDGLRSLSVDEADTTQE